MTHNVERVAAEQRRIGRLLAEEDAGDAPPLQQINAEAVSRMTEHWIRAHVSGARLDKLGTEWRWKLSAIARQNNRINRERPKPASLLNSHEAVLLRTRENQALKKKIANALHHIEWLQWIIDGFSTRDADRNYDLGDAYDQGILYEILRRASGIRPLPWETTRD